MGGGTGGVPWKEGYTPRRTLGYQDYRMDDGKLTNRYGELAGVREDGLIKGKYTIYERDEIKGTRITIVDSPTGAIVREMK
jgi:hypothetical protein